MTESLFCYEGQSHRRAETERQNLITLEKKNVPLKCGGKKSVTLLFAGAVAQSPTDWVSDAAVFLPEDVSQLLISLQGAVG